MSDMIYAAIASAERIIRRAIRDIKMPRCFDTMIYWLCRWRVMASKSRRYVESSRRESAIHPLSDTRALRVSLCCCRCRHADADAHDDYYCYYATPWRRHIIVLRPLLIGLLLRYHTPSYLPLRHGSWCHLRHYRALSHIIAAAAIIRHLRDMSIWYTKLRCGAAAMRWYFAGHYAELHRAMLRESERCCYCDTARERDIEWWAAMRYDMICRDIDINMLKI